MTCVSRLLVVTLCLVPMAAFAQTPKEAAKPPANPPTPVSSPPERTTASFGDWVMRRCAGAGKTGLRARAGDDSPGPVGVHRADRVRPRHARRAGAPHAVVLPVAVTLTTKPKIVSEKDDKSPIELAWQRCIPGGCIASTTVADDVIARLSARTEPGGIAFKDAAEHDIAVPLSLRGLTQALAALAKEP
jgi:hypothetical protein